MTFPDPELNLHRNPRVRPEPAEELAPRRRLAGPVIVLIGVVIFVAVLWQVYSMGQKAGSDGVAPLIQADANPTKVRPEQPGGLEIPHQDKLVFDRLNGGAQDNTVESLLAPPEEPLPRPVEEPKVAEATITQPLFPEEQDAEAEEPAPQSVPVAVAPEEEADEGPVEVAEPAREVASAPVPEAVPVEEPAVEIAAAPVAPAPVSKPKEVAKKIEVKAPVVSAPKPAATAKPATGGGRIQIAALRSDAEAKAEWARLQKRFPGELGSLKLFVVKVDLAGKGTYYRVQAGPINADRAQTVCGALKAQKVGCIAVR